MADRRLHLLAWLYPIGTLCVVVATGNHYLLDGAAGSALVLAVHATRSRAAPSTHPSVLRSRCHPLRAAPLLSEARVQR